MVLFDKLKKLEPLAAFSKFTGISRQDDDNNSENEEGEEERSRAKPFTRMRNIFAAPLEMAKESLDDLKDLILPKTAEQTEFLNHAFENHFVFQHLSSKEKKFLIGAMVNKSFDKDTTIIEQGTKGEYLYAIQTGTVRFLVDGVEQKDRGEAGTVFGELSLLYDCPTAASVIAETDCKVWRVSQMTFRRIKAAHAMQSDKEQRDAIVSVPFFKDLPNEIIYQLADKLRTTNFRNGELISQKGSEGRYMWIMKEGWLLATDISIGNTKMADLRLGPGEHFGERSIVTGELTLGTVHAVSDGSAWILSKEDFQRTLGHMDLKEIVIKTQDRKLLSAIPIFAYSDIDDIEKGLLVQQIVDNEYKKGHKFSTKGEVVAPALYIIRSGSVLLKNDQGPTTLGSGEIFGFGGDTLLMTNEIIKQHNENITRGANYFATKAEEARIYVTESSIKANRVTANHSVTVTEDAKIGILTLEAIGKVLYDPLRLGRYPSSSAKGSVTPDRLEKRKVLGAGTFGIVWLTRNAATDRAYALKVQYKRQLIEYNQIKGVIREKNVMARMQHPFVMSLISAQQDANCLYMVMELMQGGELSSVMQTRKRKHLAEGSARFYAAGILEGLSYMHRRHFVYRDLKGENVLLDNDGYAVVVDLGFAKYVPDKTFTFCGTPLFIAPEVILGKGHDKSADIWSYGVLLYEFHTGVNPFYTSEDMDQMGLFKQIVRGRFKFPADCVASGTALDLVEKILVLDPSDRLGCKAKADLDIRNHPWFESFDFAALYRKELTPPWKPKISNPFDGSNFGHWSDPEKEKATQGLKPLSSEEQQMFVEF